MNQKVQRPYILPLKIEIIVERHAGDIANRLESKLDAVGETKRAKCPLVGYELNGMTIDGCCALRDPICYMQRPSQKLDAIASKDDCHVLKKVVALMYGTSG